MATFGRPRTGTSWALVVRNLTVDGEVVTGDTAGATVTYALTHRGVAYGSGAMTWDDDDHEGAWSVEFLLPGTPGVLVAEVTATIASDDETKIGRARLSVQVES